MNKVQMFFNRNGSTILTCVGGVGLVSTVVLAVKATPKALSLLEEAKATKQEELSKVEVVKAAAPAYIPTVVAGAATLVCIFGANALSKRQQASLVSAYALLDSSYKAYKSKVDELYGDAAGIRVREEVAKDKYEEDDISVEEDKELFYDQFSGRYFNSTIEDVQRAEYRINRILMTREYAYANEFYEELGIEPIDAGWEMGWSHGGNLAHYWQAWIDFTHEKVVMDDGLECHIIVMQGEPYMEFMEYS